MWPLTKENAQKCRRMFQGRLKPAKALKDTTKVKNIIKVCEFKQEFGLLSAIARRFMCKVTIFNVPPSTCPNLKRMACWYHVGNG